MRKERAYTLLEILIIVALLLIFLSIGIPMAIKIYRTYKFKNYAIQLQSLANLARVKAIEKGDYIWICLEKAGFTDVCSEGNCKVTVYDVGDCSNLSNCPQKTLIKSMLIPESWVELSKTTGLNAECLIFNPHGVANINGSICISNGKNFYKLILQQGRSIINETTGPGGC